MEEKKYAYMAKLDGYDVGIMYHLGRYLVVRFLRKDTGLLTYTIRQYKTLSGASNFMKRRFEETQLRYATDGFIKEGRYWKEN